MELIGTLVGEYRIERQLGAGAMGEVYLAVHPVIGRQVAVKVLRKEIANDDSQVKRFIEEARAVTTIKHPSVVDVFGFGTLTDSRLYLVMDLLEGESFSSYLKERAPLPPGEARQWLLELLEAVAAAHDAGVVHRDLKPSNLFLVGRRGAQRLKVLDFGIARRVDRREQLTRPNVLLGSPAFMAPEQIRGESGPSCDLYSIGCIAFVMLTGQNVFPIDSLIGLLNHHLLTPPPSARALVPSVPLALDEFVRRLLAKEPSDRPASAAEARALLEDIDVTDADAPLPEQQAKTIVARIGNTEPSLEPVGGTQTNPAMKVRATETAPALASEPGATQTAETAAPAIPTEDFVVRRRSPWPVVVGGLSVIVIVAALAVTPWADPKPAVTAEPKPPQHPAGSGSPPVVRTTPPPPPRLAEAVPPPVVRTDPSPTPANPTPTPTTPVAVPKPAEKRPAEVKAEPRTASGPGLRLAKTPTQAELEARLARDEAAVREGRVSGGRAASLLLEDARERLVESASAADRIELQTFLDDWERKHLKR